MAGPLSVHSTRVQLPHVYVLFYFLIQADRTAVLLLARSYHIATLEL